MKVPERHITPGWQEHYLDGMCWCQPRLERITTAGGEEGRIWWHNAGDEPEGEPSAWEAVLLGLDTVAGAPKALRSHDGRSSPD